MPDASLLPLTTGYCLAVGGNVITDAFGVVALVAMTPLITIQILGLVYVLRARSTKPQPALAVPHYEEMDDYAIIEL